jgi:hypothetical protein
MLENNMRAPSQLALLVNQRLGERQRLFTFKYNTCSGLETARGRATHNGNGNLVSINSPAPFAWNAITDVVDAAVSAAASVGVSAEVVVASPVLPTLELRRPCQPMLEAEGSVVQVGLASDQSNRTCHRPYPAVD